MIYKNIYYYDYIHSQHKLRSTLGNSVISHSINLQINLCLIVSLSFFSHSHSSHPPFCFPFTIFTSCHFLFLLSVAYIKPNNLSRIGKRWIILHYYSVRHNGINGEKKYNSTPIWFDYGSILISSTRLNSNKNDTLNWA